MCGIAGYTHTARGIDEAVIRRMTASLTHRGPDQQGCFQSSDIALGAVRLQVIDLDGGEQPFRQDDHVIVYNGEIYNHTELRRELEKLGHRFRSHCDTEVALHAFIEWDTECFSRFRGMFAMAVWNLRNGRLVLGRDRVGIKPLYIRMVGRDVVFGSELKALFAHPKVSRTLDLNALQDYLSLNYVPSPRTLVEGIEKLPAGSFLDWQSGITIRTRWWTPRVTPDATIDEHWAEEELDRLLRDSVREHLVSDVPLGIWASGGVDSSTLLHYAAELSPKPVKTFSIAFEAKSCDERRWFRQIAELYGTDHHEFELNPGSDLVPAIEDLATYSDEPGADAGALPVWFLSRMSRKHVTVALSGEGGDELFGGYLTYRADRLAVPLRKVPAAFRRGALSAARRFLPVNDEKIGFEYKLKRWLEGSLLHPDEAHLFWNGSFSMEQKLRLLPGVDGQRLFHLYAGLPEAAKTGLLNRYLLVDQNNYLPDNLLYKVDRMSMAHSLEVRPPLLDHRIIEFARKLPERMKMRGRHQKAILKRVMKGRLPDAILNRPKQGFTGPDEFYRNFERYRKVLQESHLAAAGILRQSYIDALFQAGDHWRLWKIAVLENWYRRWAQ